MAGRGRQRIEPEFDGPPKAARNGSLSVTDDDRSAPPPRKAKHTKAGPRRASKAREPRQRRRRSGFGRLFYWMFVFSIWGAVALAGVVGYFGAKMPSASTWVIPDRAPNVRIVAADGSLLANRGVNGGEAMDLREMSPYIPQAVVAIEDRRFYSHFGFDPVGFARAMGRNVMAGRMVQGGSTLTQQLAKNLFLSPERTLERKVQEVLLALWLEHKYSKDQILEMYLNRVYFGSGAYGVEAAARRYFGKSARDVSLTEAATIAAVLKAPSAYSPARDPQAANRRAKLVLAAMRDQGMIGEKELDSAEARPVSKAAAQWNGSEQFVADRVMAELKPLIGEIKSDIIVSTTIDPDLQDAAEKAVESQIARNGEKLNVAEGALVSIDTGGAVKAYVGGVDYAKSQYDRAGTAERQPGSTFKPFVYLAALEMGRTPDSVRNDAPVKIGKWKPENYEGKYFGKVSLTTALAKSLNSVAAQLVMETGPDAVIEVAKRLGIRSKLESNLALSLGTSDVNLIELTGAYSVFANGGNQAGVHIIKRVTGADGAVLFENTGSAGARAVSPEVVAMMNYMLQRTLSEGTAKKANFGWPAAGKTGTSQSFRDAWFIGYTSQLTTGVWFGNDDNSPTKKVTGGSMPALAWKEFMAAAHQGLEPSPLPGRWQPAGDGLPDPADSVAEVGQEEAESAQMPEAVSTDALPVPLMKPSPEATGSTRRPIPPAEVGPQKKRVREPKTVLDVILGE